jgi:superfamily II DNA or RNA helicase
MSFAPGALVRARGREWVVLPESEKDLLVLRPLGGTDDEIAGVFLPLEPVEPATFPPPSLDSLGDHASCRMLRDAVRLGFRSSSGPFRSFAQLAVEPRPYQLVPLLMAMRQDIVRLLIADDVGIGKTIEAGLIARELLDRGEAKRLAVLCPPALAEQWQQELSRKFHIETELVLASTAPRLERHCAVGQSLFELYKYVVVSADFIKSDRRRDDFLRACPDLVIVDEAHTCAFDSGIGTGRHQRHQLLKGLAANPNRHLVLVTATPHSGKESAFRSLLALLRPEFAALPETLVGEANEKQRRELAQYVVQRRRGDLKQYLDTVTPFPRREELESTYDLSPEYRALFKRVLAFARETVRNADDGTHRQRIRWWAALGLLRSLASSPAAAAMTLRNRTDVEGTETSEAADEIGRRTIMDQEGDEAVETVDAAPGSQTEEDGQETETRRQLLTMAEAADALRGAKDEKLKRMIELLKKLVVDDDYHPIVFCRFIPTAGYLTEHLRKHLKGVAVEAVTGELPPSDREQRVLQLAQASKRVLVATDCLSEGINLQEHFDAVVHYDLAWNPTRHEQREGRVDRYGQDRKVVRVLTYYGQDNHIDGIVLDVLLRKHKSIRTALGVSVPVPGAPNEVLEAVFQGLFAPQHDQLDLFGNNPEQLSLFADAFTFPQRKTIHEEWEAAADREKLSRTMYAQGTIKVDEVARELAAVRGAIGSSTDVARFVTDVLRSHGATVASKDGTIEVGLKGAPLAVREALGEDKGFRARFELPVPEGVVHLQRTHPIVERLASHVLSTALDSQGGTAVAQRSGVIETKAITKRTTLLLVRLRFHILTKRGTEEWPLLAEDCLVLGFRGAAQSAEWLSQADAEALLSATPTGNVNPDRARDFLRRALDETALAAIKPQLKQVADARGADLLDAHRRVREAARARGTSHRIQAAGEPDLLGVFVLLPAAS